MAATILTTAEVAEKLDTTPRELRKFLRSEQGMNSTVGKGKRWGIEAKQMRSLTSRYNKWVLANEEAKNARAAAKADEATDEVEDIENELENDIDADEMTHPLDA